jgi:hypothetical protein
MGIKIGKLQPAQMREQISAQFGGGVLRHAYHHALLEKLRDHIGQIDRQKHQTNTRQSQHVARVDKIVDDDAVDARGND